MAKIKPHLEIVTDPVEAAKSAGLRYVSDAKPGITRKRWRNGFRYFDPEGARVLESEILARIKSLVVPPAWNDVWICLNPKGHLQATGRDARGRKQSRYHPRWREVRDETKPERLLTFGGALPTIRERVEQDLARPALPREKILAAIVRLMETTLIRVGNVEYAKQNQSYGLTTMRGKHVQVDGSTITFKFQGKSGVRHACGYHRSKVGENHSALPRHPWLRIVSVCRWRRAESHNRLCRRQRVSPRGDTATLHSEGLSHMGGYGAGACT